VIPKRIVIHHSASARDTTTRNMIRSWHKAKGWKDIGYHFVIEGDGSILLGRPLNKMGAHAKGANRDSIGICLTGDNTKPGQKWNAAQRKACRQLVTALRLVMPHLTVHGHREVGTTVTTCPGTDNLPGRS